jgi:hypothetical protein
MNTRIFLFLCLAAIHLALVLFQMENLVAMLAPLLAACIYLPLMPFELAGLPVFENGNSGGWAAPSILGWVVCLLLWSGFWWIASGLAVRYAARQVNRR